MTYRIVHKTTYRYKLPVSFGNHAAYLTPRKQPRLTCGSHELLVIPAPAERHDRVDYFGNPVTFFTIQEPHEELRIEARSEVTLDERSPRWPERSPAWDDVARTLSVDLSPESLDAYQFVFESPRVKLGPAFVTYAEPSFPPGRPLTEALLDFTARIHQEFRFDPKTTTVCTSAEEVLRKR